VKCKGCGANLDLTMSDCPACGASIELGRLTGILGVVCRACDAYNEPGAKTCAACGKPIGSAAEPPTPPAAAPPPAAATSPAAARAATPAAPAQAAPPAAPPPGSPVVRSFQKPSAGAATRFVPSVLRPSAAKPDAPAVTPIPLVSSCPRCGAETGAGRFCSQCGQPLGAKGTQVMMIPPAPGRTATGAFGALAPGRVKLVLDAGEGFEGATFRLNAESVGAGRSKGAVVFPEDPCLAPHHATFFYRGGSLHVRDEGAPGGIFLRLRGISVPLRPGDHFAIGNRLLRYAGPVPPPPTPPPDGTRRLGSPRPPSPAVVVEEWLEGGASGRVFVRGGPAVTIGRAGCAVNLGDDPHLSQAHAEILVDASGNARIKDLGSSNGTYVKVPAHAERELHDGDCVRMGHEVLRVTVA
jgi:pSer/pThr/pTyr-binding forkhead associated (FHA) protein/ribosomal protein L32